LESNIIYQVVFSSQKIVPRPQVRIKKEQQNKAEASCNGQYWSKMRVGGDG
jgi:hypothetical protein